MPRLLVVASLALVLVVPAAEARTKGVFWQQDAGVAERVFDTVGFIPIAGIQPKGAPPDTVRSGSVTYKVVWHNTTYNRRTTTALLKEIHRYGRHSVGAFTDRALKGKEKRRFDVLLDIGRDADVLVVARGNPLCESGLTRAQARGIARGEITEWSAVGAPGLGAIKRRLLGSNGYAQPRFGAKWKAGKAVVRPDGGVSELAGGDSRVAAITSWARVRFNSAVCAVPIDGVAPTNGSVFRREYKPAYPFQYVMHVKRRRDREGRALVKGYVDFLKSDKAAELFRGTGVLLVRDGEPAGGGGGPGAPGGESPFGAPTSDHAGRPIAATRDDDGAAAAVSGKRLQGGADRLIFEPDGTYKQFTLEEDGTCSGGTYTTWAVLDGYSYSENGGGWIVRVRVLFDDYERLLVVELPAAEPGTAYVDGQPYADDPGLPSDCV